MALWPAQEPHHGNPVGHSLATIPITRLACRVRTMTPGFSPLAYSCLGTVLISCPNPENRSQAADSKMSSEGQGSSCDCWAVHVALHCVLANKAGVLSQGSGASQGPDHSLISD